MTSFVHTPTSGGKGPAEDENDEDGDDEDEHKDHYVEYDEIGMSQLYIASFPTQYDEQVLQTTLGHIC